VGVYSNAEAKTNPTLNRGGGVAVVELFKEFLAPRELGCNQDLRPARGALV
jgi:hypothetical protein